MNKPMSPVTLSSALAYWRLSNYQHLSAISHYQTIISLLYWHFCRLIARGLMGSIETPQAAKTKKLY